MQARMRQILHFAAVAVCLVVVFGGTALAQSNPNLGTWKLNVAKSQFDPGPPPTSQTSVIEAWETDGVKITTTVVLADGKTRAGDTSYHYDGKDYKTLGGRGTFAAKRVDANTVAMMFKNDGKVVGTSTNVLSNNGKTLTVTSNGTTAKGQKVHEVLVWDKQ